ncbi:hypothetical protein EET67_18440 [Pseudaminobacter arsenicus]|uniref:MobA/VirD2-like nuclease domain-containing protein n=1 Tax=Borborobacter arsenicus TaxID=1851146 RepID=A0A432V2C5_9HYPH|nr:hypothetical protein [Pseudaminobacter arsenicus]RUM96327.1 hypothetical protein EET67_18440 [Pseudaminobacter arsenicus]
MEFLPGAFEREWERQRAMMAHEMQMGQLEKIDWDEPRRGGVSRLPDQGPDSFGRVRRWHGGSRECWPRYGAGFTGRSMRMRFTALARGSQPAVVKLASYGGGARATAMMNYTSRGGELAVENERGERVVGRNALSEQRSEWEHLFDNRTASRDVGVFHVSLDTAAIRRGVDRGGRLREILRSGLGDRRFVYVARERAQGELYVSGIVVLRDGDGERLTGDWKAAEIVQQRYDGTDIGRDVEARFRFHGYGNGVEWATARVRDLVASADGEVYDETGRPIRGAGAAGDLVQKEWRKELHSRKGRDVMHLIVSARAGTDAPAFERAVREFLGQQFAGHRYVFAVHDPALDPKEMAEGGKRPHVHAHAIVTVRSETGERIVTSPRLFRAWRSAMAEKAREQGIDMELTDRREFASAPAYTRSQVRPISYRGRTKHEGTSHAAHNRYQAKRSNEANLTISDRSRQYTARAAQAWSDLANEEPGTREGAFAMLQRARLEAATNIVQKDLFLTENSQLSVKNTINMVDLAKSVSGEDGQMREMTRPEFEAYEKRVEAVLASVEQTINASERIEFNEVAAVVREVVDIRRGYLDFTERRADLEAGQGWHDRQDDPPQNPNAQWDAAVARFGLQAVETANEVLVEVSHYREGLDQIETGELPQSSAANSRADLEREINRAAEMAVDGDNQYMREIAKSDHELQRAIEQIEQSRAKARPDNTVGRIHWESDLSDSHASSQNDGAPGGRAQGVPEAERHRDAGWAARSMPRQERGHPDERAIKRKPVLDAEPTRSDPPQQHVPRLRQIELEIKASQNRDHRDRER